MAGPKAATLTPPQTFPAAPKHKAQDALPASGAGIRGPERARSRREVCALAVWRRGGGFLTRRGPPCPPTIARTHPRVQDVQGPRPRCPGARSPEPPDVCARPPSAIPTHRALAAGPTAGLEREARPPGCFEALGWDCAPSLLPRGGAAPPPHVPLFPRPRLPGRDVRSQESGVGGAAGGGWGTPAGKAGAWGGRPQPQPASTRPTSG